MGSSELAVLHWILCTNLYIFEKPIKPRRGAYSIAADVCAPQINTMRFPGRCPTGPTGRTYYSITCADAEPNAFPPGWAHDKPLIATRCRPLRLQCDVYRIAGRAPAGPMPDDLTTQ